MQEMVKKGDVKLDKWGYGVKTSSEQCVSAINEYYHQVLSYGRKKTIILEAAVHDKNCVLANILAAQFLVASKSPKVATFVEAAKSNYDEATDYEKAIFDAVSYLISNNRDDDVALSLFHKLLTEFPRDLVSLRRAQSLCFSLGQLGRSVDIVQEVLPENEGQSYIYGMLSFPSIELGLMEDAERAARKALEINQLDFWAQHCLCHVLQFECRFAEAVKFMEECSPSWVSCSPFMYTHNWWHLALCYLEAHFPLGRVLDIYDNCIMKELDRPDAGRHEVCMNALALLLRLSVRGEVSLVQDRLKALADLLIDQATWYFEWKLDLLILWALASMEQHSAAKQLLEGLRVRVTKMNEKKRKLMLKPLSLAEAMCEYGKGNDKHVLELFGVDFDINDYKAIGASAEQLEVFSEMWYTLLLSTGQVTKAIEVVERLLLKESTPFLWRLLEKAYLLTDRPEDAGNAAEKAERLENS